MIEEQTGFNKKYNEWKEYTYYYLLLTTRLKYVFFYGNTKTNPVTNDTELDIGK